MAHTVKLFALSTCGWCKRTKRFLEENDITFQCTDVDLLDADAKEMVRAEVARWNPRQSYPTLVVDGREVVVGFDEARLREVLGL